MATLKFEVVDRKGKTLCTFEEYTKTLSNSSTIGELMKHIVTKSPSLGKFKHHFNITLAKSKFDINRMRLTVGDAKGRALTDKRATIGSFFTAEELKQEKIVLVFKDLGLQISWKLVFLIEYFGPILITLLFVFF